MENTTTRKIATHHLPTRNVRQPAEECTASGKSVAVGVGKEIMVECPGCGRVVKTKEVR